MHSNPRPHGLLRLFLRFPILLYRLGLGWLFGDRLALLTHIGRNSGRQRQVVIETVRMDRVTQTVYILSGWGEQSDWVLNIRANPEVLVQVGRRRWPATVVRLAAGQVEHELLAYARRRPAALAALAKRYQAAVPQGGALPGTCRILACRIPLFALQPRSG